MHRPTPAATTAIRGQVKCSSDGSAFAHLSRFVLRLQYREKRDGPGEREGLRRMVADRAMAWPALRSVRLDEIRQGLLDVVCLSRTQGA